MADCSQDGLACSAGDLRRALSIHTKKITDSCRDKDCIEDLRVYLTQGSQAVLDSAACAKVRCAEYVVQAGQAMQFLLLPCGGATVRFTPIDKKMAKNYTRYRNTNKL